MIYGKVHFRFFGQPTTAELTDRGWSVPSEPELSATFDLLANPTDFGPADGDPTSAAVLKLARILRGSHELADLPGSPPGTIY